MHRYSFVQNQVSWNVLGSCAYESKDLSFLDSTRTNKARPICGDCCAAVLSFHESNSRGEGSPAELISTPENYLSPSGSP